MGRRRALIAVVPLGLAGTAAAQTGAPASSASFPPPSASAAAPGPTAGPPSAAPPAPVPPAGSPPASAPSAAPPPAPPPPGYAPYPPYPPPYYYPWPPPGGYYEAPRDPRPLTLPYEEGRAAPPGYHVESRVRRGAVLAGSLMFGLTYGLQVLVAAAVDFEDDSEWLLVPVLGSWVFMGEVCDRSSNDDDGCSFLALHGLTQTAGAALLVYGIAAKKKRYVRDEAGFQLAPARLGSGYGLRASGRF